MFHIHINPISHAELSKSYLQTEFWAKFKSNHGWQYRQFFIKSDVGSFGMTVLLRVIKPFGQLAYVPMGPEVLFDENAASETAAEKTGRFLTELTEALMSYLPKSVFAVRFDPPWRVTAANVSGKADSNAAETFPLTPFSNGSKLKLKKAPIDIQPPDSVLIDLLKPEAEILAEMKSKWRYNIRLSQKKGVTVRRLQNEKAASDGINIFYNLYLETAKRDGIAIHSKDYYRTLCCLAQESSQAAISVYIAEFECKAIAAIVTIFCGNEAVYLYGASSNENRNLMAPYALQWAAICDARNAGCKIYDLYGIPPAEDPNHPMYGLYRFKTGFGGNIIHRCGSLDIPIKALRYSIYCYAEKGRAFWFKKIKKMFR